MHALWLIRENLTQHPGGDTTQILNTAAALRRIGVQVDFTSGPCPDLGAADVVHLFHLDRVWENEPLCRFVQRQGRPAVLSTIYWPPDEFDRGGRAGGQGWLARAFGSRAYEDLRLLQRSALAAARRPRLDTFARLRWRFDAGVRRILETAAVLLPNSRAERDAIAQRFGVERPAVVVPNAADVELFGEKPGERAPARRGVLCVGRIEPRKNQLALIEALRGLEAPLTVVGQPGRYSRAYGRRCRAAAGPHVTFLSQQPPERLRALYRSAQVHACVSWYETPGLASLEAALCGCACVVTPGGSTREYFADEVLYCRPDDVGSIRRAVSEALEAPAPAGLARRVRDEFNWQRAAEETLSAYRLALAAH